MLKTIKNFFAVTLTVVFALGIFLNFGVTSAQAAQVELQSGIAVVGSTPCNSTPNLFKEFSVEFSQPFAQTPVVVATPYSDHESNVKDTFAVTVKYASKKGFSGNIYRVDGGTCFSQNLKLNWFAISK